MNEAFIWSKVFETGFHEVDEQHRHLVQLINDASPALTDPAAITAEQISRLINELARHAVYHFREEERLMADKGLHRDFIRLQVTQHREFVAEVEAMRGELPAANPAIGKQSGSGEARNLLRFLVSWLAYHILGTDQLMAHQIRSVEAGASAEAALAAAREPRDVSMVRPLLDALTGLHQVISSRNKALRDANEALRESQMALLASNEQLEARVEERTAALKHEKAELAAALEQVERTQSQLLQSEKMAAIGQLAAGVAHEINNPIGFVNSNLGTLKSYVPQLLEIIHAAEVAVGLLPEGSAHKARYLAARNRADLDYLQQDIGNLIDESAEGMDRVKRIVQDLKDFSHVDEVEWQEADMNAGLDSTLNVVAYELKYKANVVRQYGELPKVRCVAAQVNQVFMNLLVNAAQAIENRGTITLTTRATGEGVCVEVRDTGKGMSEEVRSRIFEPFFTTKPVGQGTGLGLSIAWDIIVKKHGGRLSVSSAPGQGSCFRIDLPLAPDQAVSDGSKVQ